MFWQNPNVLIYSHASPESGTTRVNRCMLLASSLRKLGFQSHFTTNALPSRLCKKIQSDAYPLEILPDNHSLFRQGHLSKRIDELQPSWLVFDWPETAAKFPFAEHRICSLSFKDDLAIAISSSSSHGHTIGSDELLSGPEFVVVPTTSQRLIKTKTTRAILNLSDDITLLDVLQLVFAAKIPNLTTDLLMDRPNDSARRTLQKLDSTEMDIRIHRHGDRLGSLIELTDFAIVDSYAGFLKFAAAGIPCLIVANSSNRKMLGTLTKDNCIQPIQLSDGNEHNSKQIKRFAGNINLRRELSANSAKLVDGHGAERIARAMMAAMFRIRSCEMSDAERLLDWRNDPEIRVVSFEDKPIPMESHQAWLRKKLQSPFTEVYIVENDDRKPVGQFRLEFDNQYQSVRLHLSLVPSLRGMGLGTAFIERAARLVQQRFPGIEVFAQIKSVNHISQAAFGKAGFAPIATTTINGQVALRFVKTGKLFDVNQNNQKSKAA